MVKYEKIKTLKSCKTTREFIHAFHRIFRETLVDNLGLLEADYFIGLLVEGKYDKIRLDLEDMATKAKIKVMECIEEGTCDEVYEGRYKNLRELEDLIMYFIERDDL